MAPRRGRPRRVPIAFMNPLPPISELSELLGKSVLVGITRIDPRGEVVAQEQFHGVVISIDEGLVHLRVAGRDEHFSLPGDLTAFAPAKPVNYRLRATGEIVTDPDFTSSWTVRAPEPRGRTVAKSEEPS